MMVVIGGISITVAIPIIAIMAPAVPIDRHATGIRGRRGFSEDEGEVRIERFDGSHDRSIQNIVHDSCQASAGQTNS